jgi:hypothetical protein
MGDGLVWWCVVWFACAAQDRAKCEPAGLNLKVVLFKLLETYMFYRDLEALGQVHIDATARFDDRRSLKSVAAEGRDMGWDGMGCDVI